MRVRERRLSIGRQAAGTVRGRDDRKPEQEVGPAQTKQRWGVHGRGPREISEGGDNIRGLFPEGRGIILIIHFILRKQQWS